LLALLLLQACSTLTLGYNRAATLSYWWLDSQLDLNETQSQQVRADLDELHRWHRREALPRYAGVLQSWEQLARQDINAGQACEQFEAARAQLLQTAERSARPLAQLGQSVSPAQREHLQRQQTKDNLRFREDFVDAPRFGLEQRVKRLIDRLEMFYGRLEPAQRRLVQDHLARGSFDGNVALAERERRQADVLQTITAIQANPAQGPALVRAVVQRAVDSPATRYRNASRQWQREGCELVAALHNSSTAAQRQNVAENLRSYTGDFTLLAQQD
jgi:hypothetical protein